MHLHCCFMEQPHSDVMSYTVQRPDCIPLLYMYHSFPAQRDDITSKYYSVKTAVNKWKVSKKHCQKRWTNFFFIGYLTQALSLLLTFWTKLLFFHYFEPYNNKLLQGTIHVPLIEIRNMHAVLSLVLRTLWQTLDNQRGRQQQQLREVHSRYRC